MGSEEGFSSRYSCDDKLGVETLAQISACAIREPHIHLIRGGKSVAFVKHAGLGMMVEVGVGSKKGAGGSKKRG